MKSHRGHRPLLPALLRRTIPKTLLRKVPGPGMCPPHPHRGCAAIAPLRHGHAAHVHPQNFAAQSSGPRHVPPHPHRGCAAIAPLRHGHAAHVHPQNFAAQSSGPRHVPPHPHRGCAAIAPLLRGLSAIHKRHFVILRAMSVANEVAQSMRTKHKGYTRVRAHLPQKLRIPHVERRLSRAH